MALVQSFTFRTLSLACWLRKCQARFSGMILPNAWHVWVARFGAHLGDVVDLAYTLTL